MFTSRQLLNAVPLRSVDVVPPNPPMYRIPPEKLSDPATQTLDPSVLTAARALLLLAKSNSTVVVLIVPSDAITPTVRGMVVTRTADGASVATPVSYPTTVTKIRAV